MLGGKCEHCGLRDAYKRTTRGTLASVLHFHHVDPSNRIARVTSLGIRSSMAEAAKCILLCAQCHGRHHANNGRKPFEYEPDGEWY